MAETRLRLNSFGKGQNRYKDCSAAPVAKLQWEQLVKTRNRLPISFFVDAVVALTLVTVVELQAQDFTRLL